MKRHGRKAIDVACPTCNAPIGRYCFKGRICQKRTLAAAAATRADNLAARAAAKKGTMPPTSPFNRPALAPASPIWIVRDVFVDPMGRLPDAVEIVFVGHANREELERQIERLARWPWHVEADGDVTILADSHADPIGVRISMPSDVGRAARVREILVNLFTPELVAHAFAYREARDVQPL